MKDLKELLAKNIRKYRQQNNYTQEKLAELCDKSLSFISDVENARTAPSLKTLQIIADILNTEPYLLLIPENKEEENYYKKFFLNLKGKLDPKLFKLIETFLNG